MRWPSLVLLLLSTSASGSEVERADISFRGKTYDYHFALVIEADAATVRGILTDFDRLGRINDDILQSQLLEQYDENHLKRRLWINHCVLVFCFDLLFVERVEYLADGDITTEIIPAESNFVGGQSRWQIEALAADRTRVTVEASQTPRFWIPPVLGRFVIKRSFFKQIRESARRIERVAHEDPL